MPETSDTPEPSCPSCGVAYTEHLGLHGTCAELARVTKQRDALRDELRRLMDVVVEEDVESIERLLAQCEGE